MSLRLQVEEDIKNIDSVLFKDIVEGIEVLPGAPVVLHPFLHGRLVPSLIRGHVHRLSAFRIDRAARPQSGTTQHTQRERARHDVVLDCACA